MNGTVSAAALSHSASFAHGLTLTGWGGDNPEQALRPIVNENLQRLLRDLGRAVFEAISDSDDVSATVDRVREEGYTLTMQLNCTPSSESAQETAGNGRPAALEPNFKIDGQDLSFLESIGIDPTRRRPRRR